MPSLAVRQARLRGGLPAEELRSRGLEHAGRNPGCQRLQALTLASLTPATAASAIYGEAVADDRSPLAFAAGNRFERRLFASGAASLLGLYRAKGRLATTECKVEDIAAASGTGPVAQRWRQERTAQLLRRKRDGGDAPNIIIKPRLHVRLLARDYTVEPDALVASDNEPFYRPVEAKSYLDRGGQTAMADLRSAYRQAAVGVLALQQAGGGDGGDVRGDIILRHPGSFQPTLHEATLEQERASLERVVREAPAQLAALEARLASLGSAPTLQDPAILDAIPTQYHASCFEYCALAERCKRQAVERGDPRLLGPLAGSALSPAGSVGRAWALLQDRARAGDPEEAALADRLKIARQALRSAVGAHG